MKLCVYIHNNQEFNLINGSCGSFKILLGIYYTMVQARLLHEHTHNMRDFLYLVGVSCRSTVKYCPLKKYLL